MKILTVDSSGSSASIGIADHDNLIYEQFTDLGLTHSKTLVPMIENALSFCNLKPSDINLCGVCVGPGSFTGIRIGISAIKAISWVYSIPCVAISTLEAIAWSNVSHRGMICSVSDFIGEKLYCAFFQSDGHTVKRLSEDCAITMQELCEKTFFFNNNIIFVGNASNLCYNKFVNTFDGDIQISVGNFHCPTAKSLVKLSINSFSEGNMLSSSDLHPCYIRVPQAEQERLKKLGVDL